jgi:GDSL-like lipase/acylhydrolase family protein
MCDGIDIIGALRGRRLGRLTIFAKGNVDVRGTLHSLRIGGKVLWNGINEAVRPRFPGTVVRVRHELFSRSDALMETVGEIPADLVGRDLDLGPYTLESQFSRMLFETEADVFVLSVQPDVTNALLRHRRDGYLFCPMHWESWNSADQKWLREAFAYERVLDADASIRNLSAIVARIRQRSEAPILIYNLSSVDPGDLIHCYEGLEEIFSTRIRRFNLALIELSRETGISVVDVDAIVARAGADRVKLDAIHLTAEGCRLVAEEVVRILEDVGTFERAGARQCA